MVASSVEPLPLYRPRDPRASGLWQLMERYFETFRRVYDERFQAKYGFWRPIVERSVTAFLRCGDLHEGFARVRCPDCQHEMFVAFSCKQRCTCPSCHQKRTLLTAHPRGRGGLSPVAHRQVVLTIPKRLRLHTRFDRKLLGKLCALRLDVHPGRSPTPAGPGRRAARHGRRDPDARRTPALAPAHPHAGHLRGVHAARASSWNCPQLDMERLQAAWQEAVFALYLAEEKIAPEVVENMRGWPHSGFSVDQSVFLPAGRPGRHRAFGAVHDPLPVQPVAAGQGDRDRAGGLQGGEGRLPGLSRAAAATAWRLGRSGISRFSIRWISWPSSPSTFRPRARI